MRREIVVSNWKRRKRGRHHHVMVSFVTSQNHLAQRQPDAVTVFVYHSIGSVVLLAWR